MKKLLSLLTITTLTASVPAPLLANTLLTRTKRDIGTTEKYKEKKINGSDINFELITSVPIGTKISGADRNTYLKLIENDTWYLYKNNIEDEKSYSNKAVVDFLKKSDKLIFAYPIFKDVTTEFDIKIKDIEYKNWEEVYADDKPLNTVDNKWYVVIWRGNENANWRIIKFKNDNFKTIDKFNNFELQILPPKNKVIFGLLIDEKQDWGFIKPIKRWIDDKNNNYFKAVYRWDGDGEPNLPEINSSTGEITDWKQPTKNHFQQGILFSLAENDKTATWSNAGMRLTVDGETNINIDNSNVTEVYWDGAKQNMLDHKVNINVKPETSEKTHKLVIKYDINGTKYTSEDIDVVMAAKIEPPSPIVPKQLNELIKNTDLGNIIDNNDETIKAKIIEKNSLAIDFSQIKITDKADTQATLSAIKGSKSYQGSVVVKYNVTSSTTVDLKIDLTSSASSVQIDSDYLAQLDSSKMTNKVDTFYYANGKSTIKIKQPSTGNVINGKIYGCDDKWNKTSQSSNIDSVSGLEIDKGQYGSVDGRYLIELQHSTLPMHTKTIYLQISEKQKVEHYWDTPNGKQFEQWAEDQKQGYDNIRGSSASQLNNLFAVSQTWKQSLSHLDLKLDNFVVDNIKNVTQDETNTYKTKLLASVKSQVEKYAANVVENTDYTIGVDNLVAGDWTTSKDVKVQSVNGSTKLLSFTAKTIPVQQTEQPTPPTPDNNKKDRDSKLWIIGVVVGVLAGLGLAYWLFKRFVFDKYIYPKMKIKGHKKFVEKVRKREQEAEKEAENNNKGGEK